MLISRRTRLNTDQPLFSRLWGSGFLPSSHQGVRFRSGGDPVLYLSNRRASIATTRRRMLDGWRAEPKARGCSSATRRSQTRIAPVRDGVPHADHRARTDRPVEGAGQHVRDVRPGRRASPARFAANCLLARRLAERGVRFIQLYHRGWDQHDNLPRDLALQCHDTDQPTAALINDLKQRGLLDDTLVIWGGEFGRTVYCQGKLTEDELRPRPPSALLHHVDGRRRHQARHHYGETDDFGYNIVSDPVHVHDLHATILHCLGIDHTKLTYRFQGRHFRLTDVAGKVVKQVLA